MLPRSNLFEPLMADPRWPRFSAAYRYYTDDPDVDHAGAVSFGETFSLYRNSLFGGRWEVGFQAAVFSVFDMNSDSLDLVNADYWVGIPVSYRIGDFSILGRLLSPEFPSRRRIPAARRDRPAPAGSMSATKRWKGWPPTISARNSASMAGSATYSTRSRPTSSPGAPRPAWNTRAAKPSPVAGYGPSPPPT